MNPLILTLFILITGGITSYTDFKFRLIKNRHLLAIGLTYILICVYIATISFQITSFKHHLLNIFVATLISSFMYMLNKWRPGDAKLFILYALLMPKTGYDELFLLPCIVTFTNTFLFAFLLLIPLLIADLYQRRTELMTPDVLAQAKSDFLNTALMTLTLTWMVFPALEITGIERQPFLMCTAMYFIYRLFFSTIRTVKRHAWVRWACFGCGLFLRLWLSPEFFQLMPIIKYAQTVIIYNLIFYLLRLMSQTSKDINTRIPFAPFLWVGCILSYTPFLSEVMKFMFRLGR